MNKYFVYSLTKLFHFNLAHKLFSILLLFIISLMTACQGSEATLESTTTIEPTMTLRPTSTATATLAPTSTPTLTPTPKLPVSPGTIMPISDSAISADNLNEFVELARWGKGVITDAVYSPDGTIIALGSSVGISLFQVETLEEIIYIETNSGINELSFSPNGEMIAAGLKDDTARIWNVADGEVLYTLEGHTDEVVTVAFSPNESLLATGSLDGSVKLWRTYSYISTNTRINTLSSTSGNATICFSAIAGKQMTLYYYDNDALSPAWVKLTTTNQNGIACAVGNSSGIYVATFQEP